MSDRGSVAFPPFRLDLEEGRLWRDGTEVPLKPKAFALLRYLATHPRRLIAKAELIAAVWEGSLVSDATIRGTLRELRDALDTGGGTPPVVETVHGRGYRFVGAVAGPDAAASPLPPPAAPEPIFGRARALRELRTWLAEATEGRRRVGFVTGEPGIGKTSLVDVFRHEVEASGLRLPAKLVGAFDEVDQNEPLVYEDSNGSLAIAVNGGDAAAQLNVKRGDQVRLLASGAPQQQPPQQTSEATAADAPSEPPPPVEQPTQPPPPEPPVEPTHGAPGTT